MDLKADAQRVAEEMKGAAALSPELRRRFIDVRTALFRRGVYDPVLARFDSATVAQANLPEIADQLARVASSL